jgi:hypothetical protein
MNQSSGTIMPNIMPNVFFKMKTCALILEIFNLISENAAGLRGIFGSG